MSKYTDTRKQPYVTVTTSADATDETGERMVAAMERVDDVLRWLFFLCVFGVALGAVWLTILAYRLAP